MNAIDFLKRDHREIEALFEELDGAADGSREASDIFAQLKMRIEVHAQVEEEIFYSAVRDATVDSAKVIDAAEDDHARIDLLLEDLTALDEDSSEYERTLRTLEMTVRAHVAREESTMFAEAGRGLDEADLDRLGAEMEALRNDVICRRPDERRIDDFTTHHI